MVEQANASATDEIGELSLGARAAFAQLVNYLRDYSDLSSEYSMSQRLDVDRDLDELLKIISDEHAAVAAGLRSAKVRSRSDAPDQRPMDWTNIHLVLAPDGALPSNVRVPKSFQLG